MQVVATLSKNNPSNTLQYLSIIISIRNKHQLLRQSTSDSGAEGHSKAERRAGTSESLDKIKPVPIEILEDIEHDYTSFYAYSILRVVIKTTGRIPTKILHFINRVYATEISFHGEKSTSRHDLLLSRFVIIFWRDLEYSWMGVLGARPWCLG